MTFTQPLQVPRAERVSLPLRLTRLLAGLACCATLAGLAGVVGAPLVLTAAFGTDVAAQEAAESHDRAARDWQAGAGAQLQAWYRSHGVELEKVREEVHTATELHQQAQARIREAVEAGCPHPDTISGPVAAVLSNVAPLSADCVNAQHALAAATARYTEAIASCSGIAAAARDSYEAATDTAEVLGQEPRAPSTPGRAWDALGLVQRLRHDAELLHRLERSPAQADQAGSRPLLTLQPIGAAPQFVELCIPYDETGQTGRLDFDVLLGEPISALPQREVTAAVTEADPVVTPDRAEQIRRVDHLTTAVLALLGFSAGWLLLYATVSARRRLRR